jgi:hypothetical protein
MDERLQVTQRFGRASKRKGLFPIAMKNSWVYGVLLASSIAHAGAAGARDDGQEIIPNLTAMTGKDLIALVVSREAEASNHRGYYMYLSVERSERTGGHEWTERMAETKWGKVKYLIAEDGHPLTGLRLAAERARIEDEGRHPEEFKREEAAKSEDEQHARQMMGLLPKAFLFDPPQAEGEYVRVRYRPNPAYNSSGIEERVLHGMTGSVVIDSKLVRTHELDGTMPQDVSIGFGILATIHAGSNFSTTRDHLEGYDWKTITLHTDINGKALFLKTVARKQEARHSEFKRIPDGISVADAVKMLEEQ